MAKYTLTLYYSVQNGGDGSAYPQLFESMELAELDQDLMDEGWGEFCTGSYTLESNSPITLGGNESITTKESWIKDLEDDMSLYPEGDKYRKEYEKKIKRIKEL